MDKNNFKKPRYIIFYGVLILLIINLFFFYTNNIYKKNKIQMKKEEYILYIDLFENKLNFFFENVLNELDLLNIRDILLSEELIIFEKINFPILIINNDGLVIKSSDENFLNKNFSTSNFFKNTLDNGEDVDRQSLFLLDDEYILISKLKKYKNKEFVFSFFVEEEFLLNFFPNKDELVLISEDKRYLLRPEYLTEFVKNIDKHDHFYNVVVNSDDYVFDSFTKARYDIMFGVGKKISYKNYSINVIYQNYEEKILYSENIYSEFFIFILLTINILMFILIFYVFKNTKNALIVREKLKKEYIFSKTILDTIESIVLITDKKNNIKSVNKAFEKIVGYMSEEVYGKNISRFLYNINSRKVYSDSEKLIEVSWITKDKKELHTTLNKSYLYDSNGEVNNVIYSGLDTTKQKKYEKILKEKATKDQMTGLFNRNTGINYLKMLINEKFDDNILSIAYIDLDNLKQINDKYGHNVGDLYIISISNILKTSIRENDYAVRMGGDEFMLILPLCGPEDAEKVVFKNIHDKISIKNEELLSENKPKISISYGISEYSKELYDNIDSFISSADEKMYKNKSKKK
jgi:diguanylate cyclase (GGDEF)-like protein/PAS domain S-box-containing protein